MVLRTNLLWMVLTHVTCGGPRCCQPLAGYIVCGNFSCSFLPQKGYIDGNGFSSLYLHLLCLLVCVGWKGIYKGCGTGNAIKSLAFTGTVLRTKTLTRLGAAEVPADTQTLSLYLFLSLVTERSSALFSFIFVVLFQSLLQSSLRKVQSQLKVCAKQTKTADRLGTVKCDRSAASDGTSSTLNGDARDVCIREIKWVNGILLPDSPSQHMMKPANRACFFNPPWGDIRKNFHKTQKLTWIS